MHDRDIISAEDTCAFGSGRQAEAHKKAVFVSRRKPNALGEERATEKQATANGRQFGERPGPPREGPQLGKGDDAPAGEVAEPPFVVEILTQEDDRSHDVLVRLHEELDEVTRKREIGLDPEGEFARGRQRAFQRQIARSRPGNRALVHKAGGSRARSFKDEAHARVGLCFNQRCVGESVSVDHDRDRLKFVAYLRESFELVEERFGIGTALSQRAAKVDGGLYHILRIIEIWADSRSRERTFRE